MAGMPPQMGPQGPQGPTMDPSTLMTLLAALQAGKGQIPPTGDGAKAGQASLQAILPMLLKMIQMQGQGGMPGGPPGGGQPGQPQLGGPQGQPQPGAQAQPRPGMPPGGGQAAQQPQPQVSPQVMSMIQLFKMLGPALRGSG
jgi:integrin beta 8